NQSNVLYQLLQDREIEEFVASEKTIRDLAARMSDRIGIPVRFEFDRTKEYKGKLDQGTADEYEQTVAVINLAYATLDTPIHEILGHPIIRVIKNTNPQLYQNLLKELEYGRGKEVLDRVKRDYNIKGDYTIFQMSDGMWSVIDNNNVEKPFGRYGTKEMAVSGLPSYTLEEQQEEALVQLLGLMTAGKLDSVKDGKLISLLKRLLKEIKSFVRDLLKQREVEIDKLPDNMTIGDLSDLLAYSNSKLILPGYEVQYTTPDNQKFSTYAEASKHISELVKSAKDIDLNKVKIQTYNRNKPLNDFYVIDSGRYYIKEDKFYFDSWNGTTYELTKEQFLSGWNNYLHNSVFNFIEKNREYEQSKEIIEEWKKVNNIQYNPEEIYSRGQEFCSVVGAYSLFDVNLMMQNLLQHIEDNEKAGGKFAISAFTKPIGKTIRHLEGRGGKIKFKIYPKSEDILWASNIDAHSGSVWDASEKINEDKKSELLGVSFTKYPSLRKIDSVQPNLASIVDDLAYHHNELGIVLTGNNFRLEYDEDVPYSTKKLINSINSILDQKYGKLVKPEITLEKRGGIQPTQTNETLKESIESVTARVLQDKKEYTEQALINTKIAKLKEVAKKYPRSLIRSEVKPIRSSAFSDSVMYDAVFDPDELPFQKASGSIQYQKQIDLQAEQDAVLE
ncbi:MAG TPA: hypothetical protein PK432_02365, partial [Candidatus Dojkabacteria bacterium]|nr:hypothetical protein [Candidatus Dojkabacteria bacterium]